MMMMIDFRGFLIIIIIMMIIVMMDKSRSWID